MTTYLRLIRPTANMAVVGEAWVLGFYVLDASTGYPDASVTPAVAVTDPSGNVSNPTPAEGSVLGYWTLTTTLDESGRWTAHVSTSDDAADVAIFAYAPVTDNGMPSAGDCQVYLKGRASGFTLAEVQDALDAEAGAQRAKCGERNPYPADLRQALLRRVSRNLALRSLPLAVVNSDADTGATILPGSDPEVRRLEAPWRKLVVG